MAESLWEADKKVESERGSIVLVFPGKKLLVE